MESIGSSTIRRRLPVLGQLTVAVERAEDEQRNWSLSALSRATVASGSIEAYHVIDPQRLERVHHAGQVIRPPFSSLLAPPLSVLIGFIWQGHTKSLTEGGIGLLGWTISHFVNYDYLPKIRQAMEISYFFIGLHCARLAGVPNEIIQRATGVLEDIHSKRPIKRVIWDKLAAKDQEYQDAVTNLLAFDVHKGDLNSFSQEIFPSES